MNAIIKTNASKIHVQIVSIVQRGVADAKTRWCEEIVASAGSESIGKYIAAGCRPCKRKAIVKIGGRYLLHVPRK